jgi:two-component system, sensor histidine kinase PdtaS
MKAVVSASARRWLDGGNTFVACGAALLLSAVAAAVRLLLDDIFPPGFPFVTFFPAVILSSFLFGSRAGIVAALACGLTAWYLFIPPLMSFRLVGGTWLALVFYAAVAGLDIALIHWLQRANRHLEQERERSRALAERSDLLFRELQHRVANNLQMVGAVLHHHRRSVDDPLARAALNEAGTKLQLIGRIQRQLYDSAGEPVALDTFLADLVEDVMAAGSKPGLRHTLRIEPGLTLSPDTAIPLALILAEGIANAIEHGFAERDHGCIAVTVTRHHDSLALVVADDGDGLSPEFDLDAATSLGLRVARTLARQIGGTLTLCDQPRGTALRLVIPSASGAGAVSSASPAA